MKKSFCSFLFILTLLHLGTTYVIKEGDTEVGRYEESDGKTEIREIAGDTPKAIPLKKETKLIASGDEGYGIERVETGRTIPDKNETWRIQGRALDLLSVKPLTQGRIRFLSPDGNAEIPISWNGMFSGKIPKLDGKKAYQLALEPPAGYTNHFLIYHSGRLLKLSPQERSLAAQAASLSPLVHIDNHYLDLEIAVLPKDFAGKEAR